MKKSGGIIAIIAGVLGVIAAFITLFVGGLGSAFNAENGQTVVGLGWLGILASILVIVFGATALSATKKTSSVLLILTSIFGAIFGGMIVAIFMALSLIGGLLAFFGTNTQIQTAQNVVPDGQSLALQNGKKSNKAVYIILGIISFILILGFIGSNSNSTQKLDEYEELETQASSSIQPDGELYSIFELGGDSTDLQRENKLAEIKGKIVEWNLEVYEVDKDDDVYKIQTRSDGNVGTFTYIKPRNESEKSLIESLKTGSTIRIKGVIKDSFLRNMVIKPAIFALNKSNNEVTETLMDKTQNDAALIEQTEVETSPEIVTTQAPNTLDVIAPLPEAAVENKEVVPATVVTANNEELKIEPSFDCSLAKTSIEKLICSNAELANLDYKLAQSYKQNMKLTPEDKKAEEIATQRAWLKTRTDCTNVDCLINMYAERDKDLAPWNYETHE